RITASYQVPIERSPIGTPLDEAMEQQERSVSELRADAADYFLDHPHELLDPLRARYTFLYPPELREELSLGPLIARSETWIAVRYQRLLWKEYLERFTRVREGPGKDPYSVRFRVDLDLRLFCRYRQRVGDLVTRD